MWKCMCMQCKQWQNLARCIYFKALVRHVMLFYTVLLYYVLLHYIYLTPIVTFQIRVLIKLTLVTVNVRPTYNSNIKYYNISLPGAIFSALSS